LRQAPHTALRCPHARPARFDSADTFPLAGGRWADPLPIVDAKWSPDGGALSASDAGGCLSLYRAGAPDEAAAARLPFDQFLESDYAPLTRDLRGWVVDAAAQVPPHVLAAGEALCDFLTTPYGAAVQAAYRARGAGAALRAAPLQRSKASAEAGGGAVGSGARAGGGGVELAAALVTDPPSVTAAVWACVDAGQRSEAALVVGGGGSLE
jgi:hypothetical protein